MPKSLQQIAALTVAMLLMLWSASAAFGYSFYEIVPDVREPGNLSGGSSCPVRSHQLISSGAIAYRWSTVLGTSPTTILTQDQTPTGSLNEIEQAINQAISVWTNVAGTSLNSTSFAPVTRVASSNICASDGINSICLDQPDPAFTPGVLAFTRVITADQIGIQLGSGAPSTDIGQILDADIYFNPSDSLVTFATPAALATHPGSYDLESLLIHEFGHSLGFSHTAVWSAIMYPFAAAPGTFAGMRPTAQQPDAPLADDDRTGLRILYHNPADTLYVGSIQGRILPANPLSLPASPPGVTGIFGAQVVAFNADTGSVVAGTLGGWSCHAPGPADFDGSYEIDALPVNQSYLVYAEPLNGVVGPAQVAPAIATLCRNATTDPGWPPLQACVVPQPDTEFTVGILSSP
jgi:hypothetical protein